MENLNEVLERIETLLKELRDSFLESRRWGADNTFIDTINEIYNLIKYEKESLTRQKEEMIFLEGQILTNLNNVLIDLIKKIKESMDSSVNEVRNVIKPSIYEFRNLMDSSVKEVRKATESFNNYLQKKKFLSSAKKELKELRSKVHYFKKMQVGRDYNFSIQISYNNDNFLTLKFEDLDFISTEFTIGELPKKAEDGFIIRLIAPSMTINPSFRKIVIDSENKLAFYKHIYFKITPNYSGAFIIMMELTLEDEIISPPKEFEVSV